MRRELEKVPHTLKLDPLYEEVFLVGAMNHYLELRRGSGENEVEEHSSAVGGSLLQGR